MSPLWALQEWLVSRDRAVVLAHETRGEPGLDRLHALALVAPEHLAEVAVRVVLDPSHPRAEEAGSVRLLAGLPGEVGAGALGAAARVRHAADLAVALDEARALCLTPLERAWFEVALAGRGLVRRSHGQTTACMDPATGHVSWPGGGIDLSASPRRFALLWALATAPGPLDRDTLFELVWGRALQTDADARALQVATSRARAVLPASLDLRGLAAGSYDLHPDWAVFAPRDAPLPGLPLAPLGRDAEAARVRLALREGGRVALVGPPGSGTTTLARCIGASWPGGWRYADLRVTGDVPGTGDSLCVVDHAPEGWSAPVACPLLVAGEVAPPGLPVVVLGPLPAREAEALAVSLGVDPPGRPAYPGQVRCGPHPLADLDGSERALLGLLLAHPEGVPMDRVRELVDIEVATTALERLEERRLVRREARVLVAVDALRGEVQVPQRRWAAPRREQAPPEPPCDDLERASVQLRRALATSTGHRGWNLLWLARLSVRLGRPDVEVERALRAAAQGVLAVAADLYFAERLLWSGEPWRALEAFEACGHGAGRMGLPDLSQAARLGAGRTWLALGVDEPCESILGDLGPAGRVVLAGLALDRGDLERAAELLDGCEPGAERTLRQAQLAEARGGDPAAAYARAVEGFRSADRRWLAVALALLGRVAHDRGVLQAARAAVPAGDAASAAAVTLAQATLDGRLGAAVQAIRFTGHRDATTFPWDPVRWLTRSPSRA